MRRLRIGHYYPRQHRENSGVTAAITAWAGALEASGHESVLLSDSRDHPSATGPGTSRPIRHVGNRRATFVPVGLTSSIGDLDLLYLHEGWTLSNVAAAKQARRARVPYVVMPHGVYEPGILETLKAPIGLRRRAEAGVLRGALAAHVYFPTEATLVTAISARARTFVAPTGAELPEHTWTGGGGYVAWFGRYEPHHKGLDLLLYGLAAVPRSDRPLLQLRGYDYDGGKGRVESLVAHLRLGREVEVGGEVRGDEKEKFLAEASAYVHPSRWESHSIALVEVLGRGVPVAVSRSIHVAGPLESASAALLADATAHGWARVLGAGDALGDPTRGQRGRNYVAEQLAWPTVIAQWERGVTAAGLH